MHGRRITSESFSSRLATEIGSGIEEAKLREGYRNVGEDVEGRLGYLAYLLNGGRKKYKVPLSEGCQNNEYDNSTARRTTMT